MQRIGGFYPCEYCKNEASYFGLKKLCGKHYDFYSKYLGSNNKEDGGDVSEYNEFKASLTRNDKGWQDNIRSRRVVEKNGKKMTVYKTKSGAERAMPVIPMKMREDPNWGKSKK